MLNNVIKANIESTVAKLEEQLKNNEKVNLNELNDLLANFEFLTEINSKEGNNIYTTEELESLKSRIDELSKSCDITPLLKAQAGITDRSVSIPAASKGNIKKRLSNKALVGALVAGLALGGLGVYGFTRLNAPKTEVVTETKDENERDIDEITKDITNVANDMFEKGMPEKVTEETKEAFCKDLILNYYALRINDNNVNGRELASVFGDTTFVGEDLTKSMHKLNWLDEQRVTVGDSYLDYSLQYSKKLDADFLNEAATKIDKVKKASDKEKKAVVAEFKEFIKTKLEDQNNRMNYSELALNTFRAVYFDAFDELTGRKVIDDELEHLINTTYTCANAESPLKVEDKTITSLQSDFETYLSKKFDQNMTDAKEYAKAYPDKLDKEKTYNEILKRVCAALDLSKQKENPDYKEAMRKAAGVYAPAQKHPNDSGINIPGVGNISKQDVDKARSLGVTSNDPNEIAEALRQNDKEEYYANESGQKITENDADEMENGALDGNVAGNQGLSKNYRSSSAAYRQAYDAAYANAYSNFKEVESRYSNQTEEHFEPVNNAPEQVTESVKEEGYTNNNVNPAPVVQNNVQSTPNVTFVPIESGSESVVVNESNEVVHDYLNESKTSYSTSEQIELLNGLKSLLTEENSMGEAGKTK